MNDNNMSRRKFVQNCTIVSALGAGLSGCAQPAANQAQEKGKFHLATNSYPWQVFYARKRKNYSASLDNVLGEIAATGLDGYEPIINSPVDIDNLAPLLKKHKLQMPVW